MRRLKNPFTLPGRWYKANLHTHTTTSDGEATLARRVVQYRQGEYSVLAITDHRKTNEVGAMADRRILVLGGMEFHPPCPRRTNRYHLVALNVPHGLEIDESAGANACIEAVRRAGGETILAHPHWSGGTYEDLRDLHGLAAVEIYNATCDRHCRASSESLWSDALDRGTAVPIVGCDDAHGADSEDVMECWTWLKMPALTAPAVLEALRTGACYASCGPVIHDFSVSDGKVHVRCAPAASIYFLGGPDGQGARRRCEKGKTITTLSMPVPKWRYVRAVVVDSDGRRAWTNPIAL